MSENISYYGLLQPIRYKHKYNVNIRIRIGFWVANIQIQFFVFVSALVFMGLVCWSLTSLCHSNGHIETMPAREINPFTALTRIRYQFLGVPRNRIFATGMSPRKYTVNNTVLSLKKIRSYKY